MKKQWTVAQLEREMIKDLALCQSDFERGMVRAICGKEIRNLKEPQK